MKRTDEMRILDVAGLFLLWVVTFAALVVAFSLPFDQ
jgi:hypothetical protein